MRGRASRADRVALVAGGIAPDVALNLLNLAAVISSPLADGVGVSAAHRNAMDDLYFNSSWWIVGHNLLHAPFILVTVFAGAFLSGETWRRRIRIFATVHTLTDIAAHHDDGSLLPFPFSWTVRFASPVGYWAPTTSVGSCDRSTS